MLNDPGLETELENTKQSLKTDVENTKTIPWNRCLKMQINPGLETELENTKTIP